MPTRNNVVNISARGQSIPSTESAPPSSKPLRVLIVDDTPEDRRIIRNALASAGYLLSEADNGAQALASVDAIRPDCIVLDAHLPDTDCFSVLAALARQDNRMPCAVVMLTDDSNGEMVRKILHAGALDYLHKQHLDEDNMRRLVQNSVERYRLQQERRQSQLTNAHLAAIVSASQDAILSTSLDDRVISWNPAATRLFGFEEYEVLGKPLDALIVPEEHIEERRKLYQDVKSGQRAITIESVRHRKDGSRFAIEIKASPIFDDGGNVVALSLIKRDITERTRVEDALAMSAAIIGSTDDAVMSLDPQGRFTSWNSAAEQLFGYSASEVIGREADLLVAPLGEVPFGESKRGAFDRAIVGGKFHSDTRRVAKDGTVIDVSVTASRITAPDGRVVGVSAIMRDIRERKRAELALLENEARYRGLFDNAATGIVIGDDSRRIREANAAFLHLLGYTAQEMIGLSFDSLIHPEDRAQNVAEVARVRRSEVASVEIENRYVHKTGRAVWVRKFVSTLRAGSGVQVFALVTDISERKRREADLAFIAALSEAFSRHSSVAEIARLTAAALLQHLQVSRCMLVDIDTETATIFCDAAAGELPSLIGEHKIADFHSQDEQALLQAGVPVAIADVGASRAADAAARFTSFGIASLLNVSHVRQGELRFVISLARSVPNPWSSHEIDLVQDVANRVFQRLERARVEEALQLSEQQFRTMAEGMPQIVWSTLANGKTTYLNQRWVEYTGLTLEESYGDGWLIPFHPDDRERAWEAWEAATNRNAKYELECRLRRHDGVYRRWLIRGAPLLGADGRVEKWFGTCTDIEDVKKATDALAASEARFQLSMDATSDGLWDWDVETNATYFSPSNFRIIGYAPGDSVLTTEQWHSRIHPEDRDQTVQCKNACVQGVSDQFSMEYRIQTQAGAWRWVLSRGKCVSRDPSGRATRLIGTHVDITERKQDEEALRSAHHTFRHLVEHSPFGIYAIDADFRVMQVSAGAQKVFENVKPLIGRDLADVLSILWPEPFASEAIARFRHTLATGEAYHSMNTMEHRADIDATEAYDWKIERIMMPDGRPGVVCHFYDLSERKRHEEHVRLLMLEVNHRSKNMLALVQAIARRTATSQASGFIDRFDQRLRALAANQDLLIGGNWMAVPLDQLIRTQLSHLLDEKDARVQVEGPKIELKPAAAETLGIAFHELSTNAIKHGSLSIEKGRVDVKWALYHDARGEQRLTLSWTESHGPEVKSPLRQGFGATVLGRMVEMGLSAKALLQFSPQGLRWSIDCPTAAVMHDREPPL